MLFYFYDSESQWYSGQWGKKNTLAEPFLKGPAAPDKPQIHAVSSESPLSEPLIGEKWKRAPLQHMQKAHPSGWAFSLKLTITSRPGWTTSTLGKNSVHIQNISCTEVIETLRLLLQHGRNQN